MSLPLPELILEHEHYQRADVPDHLLKKNDSPYPQIDFGGISHCLFITLSALLNTVTCDLIEIPQLRDVLRKIKMNHRTEVMATLQDVDRTAFAHDSVVLEHHSRPSDVLAHAYSQILEVAEPQLADPKGIASFKEFVIGISRHCGDDGHASILRACHCKEPCLDRCLHRLVHGRCSANCQHKPLHFVEYQYFLKGKIRDDQAEKFVGDENGHKKSISLFWFKHPARAIKSASKLKHRTQDIRR